MGFDLLLVSTNVNGLAIPTGAKCAICLQLLDDGVGLSGCLHNSCFKCMKKLAANESKCPLDGQPFDWRRYYHLDEHIEGWLSNIKLKCQYFDGQVCTATAIAIRNARRHWEICPNNPKNRMSSEQINAVKLVENWMQNNEIMGVSDKCDNGSTSSDGRPAEESLSLSRPELMYGRPKPRSGYGFRPTKRTIGRKFFTSELNPEIDSDWRK